MFDDETQAMALERLAAFAEEVGFTFSKFESIGDEIVMLAGTRWEHDNIIDILKEQVPRRRECKITGVDLRLTSEPREPIPDLIVVPNPLPPGVKPWAHETDLLVEVVSQSNFRADYEGKKLRYAQSGAPQYLLIDPRDGLCILHSEPDKTAGKYQDARTTGFGEAISGVLCMDGADLDTSEFPRYT